MPLLLIHLSSSSFYFQLNNYLFFFPLSAPQALFIVISPFIWSFPSRQPNCPFFSVVCIYVVKPYSILRLPTSPKSLFTNYFGTPWCPFPCFLPSNKIVVRYRVGVSPLILGGADCFVLSFKTQLLPHKLPFLSLPNRTGFAFPLCLFVFVLILRNELNQYYPSPSVYVYLLTSHINILC